MLERLDIEVIRSRWLERYFIPLLIVGTLLVAGYALVLALEWRGRPFCGFLATPSGFLGPFQLPRWEV